jgi:hypothetical protein
MQPISVVLSNTASLSTNAMLATSHTMDAFQPTLMMASFYALCASNSQT